MALRILLIEDDPTSCKILNKFLEPFGKCDVATNGRIALEMFKEALLTKMPYQLVCLDIMMPEIDGHVVLKSLRQEERSHQVEDSNATKVIMITALDDSANVLSAFRGGCEAYLSKPIDKEKLYHELRKLKLIPAD